MKKLILRTLDSTASFASRKSSYIMIYLANKGRCVPMSQDHTSDTIDGVFMDNDNASYDATAKGFIARKVFWHVF